MHMNEYQQLSEKRLRFGYWFVTNKLLLKRLLTAGLFLINMLVWGYILFSLVMAFGVEYQKDRLIERDLVVNQYSDVSALFDVTQPRPLLTLSVATFTSFENRLDALARLRNPNASWGAEFAYQFNVSDGTAMVRRGFIMPGEEKYLFDLDIEGRQVLGVTITDIRWIRENDFATLQAQRAQFEVRDVAYIPKAEENIEANRAVFTVVNNSSFNYYEPRFQVLLQRGSTIVGIQEITVDRLMAGQSRTIEVRWIENIPAVQSVQVILDINYLAESAYVAF